MTISNHSMCPRGFSEALINFPMSFNVNMNLFLAGVSQVWISRNIDVCLLIWAGELQLIAKFTWNCFDVTLASTRLWYIFDVTRN